MVRFALNPEGDLVPDILARLPGRGVWLEASRESFKAAVEKRLFSRGFKARVRVPENLTDMVERLLCDHLVSTLALARKAGQAITGFEKVKAHLLSRPGVVLAQAVDGAPEQREKLARLVPEQTIIRVLSARELGLAFGRGFAIHAALDTGGLASRALSEAWRLSGLRPGAEVRAAGDPDAFGNLKTAKGPEWVPVQDTG